MADNFQEDSFNLLMYILNEEGNGNGQSLQQQKLQHQQERSQYPQPQPFQHIQQQQQPFRHHPQIQQQQQQQQQPQIQQQQHQIQQQQHPQIQQQHPQIKQQQQSFRQHPKKQQQSFRHHPEIQQQQQQQHFLPHPQAQQRQCVLQYRNRKEDFSCSFSSNPGLSSESGLASSPDSALAWSSPPSSPSSLVPDKQSRSEESCSSDFFDEVNSNRQRKDLVSAGAAKTKLAKPRKKMNPPTSSEDDHTAKSAATGACPVCASPMTGKHNYYGANVCVSCRGFFRRSVQNDYAPLYKCLLGTGRCPIDSKSRQGCKWCRFQKCLSCGMRTTYVMTGQDRRQRIVSRASVSSQLLRRRPDAADLFQFSAEEKREYLTLSNNWCTMYYTKFFDYYEHEPEAFLGMTMSALHLNDEADGNSTIARKTMRLEDQVMKNFAFSLLDSHALTACDKVNLLNRNLDKLAGLDYLCSNRDCDIDLYFSAFLDHLSKKQQPSTESIGFITRNISSYLARCKAAEKKSWAPVPAAASHDADKADDSSCLRESDEMPPDEVIFILLFLLLLFSADGVHLENPGTVDTIQSRYLWSLNRYLRHKHGKKKVNGKLHRLIMLQHYCEAIGKRIAQSGTF